MKISVEAVSLTGPTVRVSAPDPVPAERAILALASAIRVFDRFPVLDALVLAGGEHEVTVTRADVERALSPEGFAALRDRGRWPQVLARAAQQLGAGAGEAGS